MIGRIDKNKIRKRKHVRVRKKISGTTECPRLCVYRSNSHIYAQISVSVGSNIEAAKAVGKLIGERAIAKDIKDVVFDRGGYLYHGRVQALAEAAREAGLSF